MKNTEIAEKVGAVIMYAAQLTDPQGAAVIAALGNDGKLRRNKPSDGMAAAAWCGIMWQVNPYKVKISDVMQFGRDQRKLFDILCAMPWPSSLDHDRENLEAIGAW